MTSKLSSGNITCTGLTTTQNIQGGSLLTMDASALTPSGPTTHVYPSSAATTDATVTTIQTVNVPAAICSTWVEAKVMARRTGGTSGNVSDCAYFRVVGLFYYGGSGSVTMVGTSTVKEVIPSGTAYDVNIAPGTGATIIVTVTGVATTNISWQATVSTGSMS